MLKAKKLFLFNTLGVFLFPFTVLAQGTVQNFLWTFVAILNFAIPALIGFAMVFFFWGLVKFLVNVNDENARAEGKKILVWGIIALFVIISFWGIVIIIQNIFFPTGILTDLPGGQNF